jgi:hypothetical protein
MSHLGTDDGTISAAPHQLGRGEAEEGLASSLAVWNRRRAARQEKKWQKRTVSALAHTAGSWSLIE